MAKIGRNEPCSCGSGKKYKHCCSEREAQQAPPTDLWGQDTEWLKIRRTEGEVVTEILKFTATEWPELMEQGAAEFREEFDIAEAYVESLFIPWLVFNWVPELIEKKPSKRPPPERQLSLEYLGANLKRLDDYHQRFIRAASAQPFSFFVVTDAVPGKSLGLRDILVDRIFTVKEAQASKTLKRGDIIFARVVPLDGQAIVVGMGPIALPPSEHGYLLDVRDDLKKKIRRAGLEFNLESLGKWDLPIRNLYLSRAAYVANPPRPQLQNTDGDPISFVKLFFELGCSAQEAFDGLRSLALSQEGILEDATHDENGKLVEVHFDWMRKGNKQHKSWDNTVLGNLKIKGQSLTAEVNSEKRAQKIQSEITKRLGGRAVFMRSENESIEAKLKEMEAQSGSPAFVQAQKEQAEFASRPEVQAAIRAQMDAHWKGWFNERVPALQNKTPLQAARTKDGRERLEALLLDYERKNEGMESYLQVDVEALRRKLGL